MPSEAVSAQISEESTFSGVLGTIISEVESPSDFDPVSLQTKLIYCNLFKQINLLKQPGVVFVVLVSFFSKRDWDMKLRTFFRTVSSFSTEVLSMKAKQDIKQI